MKLDCRGFESLKRDKLSKALFPNEQYAKNSILWFSNIPKLQIFLKVDLIKPYLHTGIVYTKHVWVKGDHGVCKMFKLMLVFYICCCHIPFVYVFVKFVLYLWKRNLKVTPVNYGMYLVLHKFLVVLVAEPYRFIGSKESFGSTCA